MILLLGATGLLGGQVLRRMVDRQYPTRLLVRGSSDWKDASMQNLKQRGVDMCIADVTDKDAVMAALVDCTAVVNLIGSMPPNNGVDMQFLHVTAVDDLVKAAQRRNVQRFIHVSCLGARADSPSVYLRTKALSEDLVKKGEHYWTVFKPSYLFSSKEFPFLDVVLPLAKFKMCLPVLGSGMNQIQPINVDNVADCIVDSIYKKECVSQTYELGGPETYSMQEFMEYVRDGLGIGGPTFNIPTTTVAKASAALTKLMPRTSISEEVVNLIMANSFTDRKDAEMHFSSNLVSFDSMFDRIMDAY